MALSDVFEIQRQGAIFCSICIDIVLDIRDMMLYLPEAIVDR